MTCPLNLPFLISISPVIDKKRSGRKRVKTNMNLEYTSSYRHLITIEMDISKTNYIMSKILV